MKVKLTTYRGMLVIEALDPEKPHPDWVPSGKGKIGCLINGTKTALGVSDEALAMLRKVKRNTSAIGDVMWFDAGDDSMVFGWIGPTLQIFPDVPDGDRDYKVRDGHFVPIPNEAPDEARKLIDDHFASAE